MSLAITVTFVAHQIARASDLEQLKSDVQTWGNNLESVVKLGTGGVLKLGGIYSVDGAGAETVRSDMLVYEGWGYINGNGTSSITANITLPNGGFDDGNYNVQVDYLGSKTSIPANRADVNGENTFAFARAHQNGSYGTTAFTVKIVTTAGSFAAGTYQIFQWVALGKKA